MINLDQWFVFAARALSRTRRLVFSNLTKKAKTSPTSPDAASERDARRVHCSASARERVRASRALLLVEDDAVEQEATEETKHVC